MRSLLTLALLAAPTVAAADDRAKLEVALHDLASDAAAAALADTVDVELPIETPACKPLSGVVGRAKLLPCLRALAANDPVVVVPGIGARDPILGLARGISFQLKLTAGKIVGIHPIATNQADARTITTISAVFVTFHPSPQLAATIDKQGGIVSAIHKVCADPTGKITSRRIVAKSGLAAFDMESTAWVAALGKQVAFKPWGTAIAMCDLVTVEYPLGEEGGVVGGEVAGGVEVPPPPPPPPRPQNITAQALEGSRIAGQKQIEPDDNTKRAIAAAGKEKVVASFKLCVSNAGDITTVVLLKSSGFTAYDDKLKEGIRTWRYRPYIVNGNPVPVCTAVTFIYSQSAPTK